MLLAEFVKAGTKALESLYPQKEARSIVLMLCEEVLGTENYTHIVEPEFKIDDKKLPELEAAMERLKKMEPVQYVLGHTEFYGRTFKVDPAVLIPRPETELLCRDAIKLGMRVYRMRSPYGKNAEPVRILDLCTGSGCIAWTMALSIPGSRVTAVDISDAALEVAAGQDFASELKSKETFKPEFIKADVLDSEQEIELGPFDMVLSNPPYIMESEKEDMRRNVLEYEPESALFVPDDDPLLFYRAIARWSQRFMSPDGVGLSEVNESLARQTETVFKAAGYAHTEIVRDLSDKNRYIIYHK
ncbi:MAG: peptide chain release factor N(5)-glutamine methyltransferase [Candidatus Cryptobacteroides sp.]|jgi:release factor glutamine methyltransferase|uniref:peptide chain release factor N(5)-glutamine methyltransferase n=1 Tax=Candidatus Cryptobacteroides bacterium TaxID=3085639 RepID=UPI002A939ED1|nr:peptide chain release factor N(5)-glutamine methyltransferase [Bacteroides sp.]MDY5406697.1 peptide chain release factor N(5)-glutamine methyltransferase [Candidatus Cryptobacteroides sp.]